MMVALHLIYNLGSQVPSQHHETLPHLLKSP
ncbi:unnamed protein product, partial [Vitis vinifera]|uniref:Uncharacterized protein n=1 Tax=Vitis vinifera TaxID=29760 RepID=D7TAT8_VITVI